MAGRMDINSCMLRLQFTSATLVVQSFNERIGHRLPRRTGYGDFPGSAPAFQPVYAFRKDTEIKKRNRITGCLIIPGSFCAEFADNPPGTVQEPDRIFRKDGHIYRKAGLITGLVYPE